MGIVLEFIPSLFLALAFDFVLYATGAFILRIVSVGLHKPKVHSYSEFKAIKAKFNKGFIVQYIVGILFYVLVIAPIMWFN